MRPKLEEKRKVQAFRKQGFSYKEILEKVGVAKSSVSLWCRDIELTFKQKERLDKKRKENLRQICRIGPRTLALRREREIRKIKEMAKREIYQLTLYQLKIVGAMLYWAEGSKGQGSGVQIANSDPELIRFMTIWLSKICGVSPKKLKAWLNIHANQDDKKIEEYWSNITGIPLGNFGKSYIKPEGTGHRKNILSNGVIRIQFGSEDLKQRIMSWIQALYCRQLLWKKDGNKKKGLEN